MSLFGEAAARLSSAASMVLAWRPDEFWRATPAELALAMNLSGYIAEGPDAETSEALRERFPDDSDQKVKADPGSSPG